MFHGGTIAFSWTMADTVPREDVMARFEEAAEIMMRAAAAAGDRRAGGGGAGGVLPGAA